MIQKISLSKLNFIPRIKKNKEAKKANESATSPVSQNLYPTYSVPTIVTSLTSQADKTKYEALLNEFKNYPVSEATNLSVNQELDILLKSGKLLSKTANDKTSVLDNIYEMLTTPRAEGLDRRILIANTLDDIVKPSIINQQFGDIPDADKVGILSKLSSDDETKKDNSLMDVNNSGTCAAASCEVNMADKYPAEFARWVNKLSSVDKKVVSNINLTSLSQNPLETADILNLMQIKKTGFDLAKNQVTVEIKADDHAYLRAKNQCKNWDNGERNVADVLVQGAIMQTGSQNTYDSLTDIRAGEFNTNPQGLIELEKTFVESLIKNKEITSLVYHQIDDEQNLVGYNCSMAKIEQHIKDTIDSGDDVILGYVLTNETAGRTKSQYYNPATDGKPNKVINGHEITVVDYKTDKFGHTKFICVDTDDNSQDFVTYDAEWLLPKIHHAGYPATIVENDVAEIMQNEFAAA